MVLDGEMNLCGNVEGELNLRGGVEGELDLRGGVEGELNLRGGVEGELNLRGGVESELEEVIGDLGAALSREDEHIVASHGAGKVTAGRRDVALLVNLEEDQARTSIP